jgi:nucleotide-binding universal stress UspA family protein
MKAIVVGTDGSPGAEAAVQKVIEIARGSGTTVHVVCAYPGRSTLERIGLTAKTDPVNLRGVAADVVARDERRFEEAGFDVEVHVREGDAAHTLADVAEENDAGMIVVGARGHGPLRRFALGSVSAKLAHDSPTSLLIVRDD